MPNQTRLSKDVTAVGGADLTGRAPCGWILLKKLTLGYTLSVLLWNRMFVTVFTTARQRILA